MFGRARWLLVRVLVGASIAYGVTFIVLWTQLEKRFVFFPVAELLYTPNDVNLEFEDVRIQTSDGLELQGWFVPGEPETASGPDSNVTWLWFHGNGGNIGHRIGELALAQHPFQFLPHSISFPEQIRQNLGNLRFFSHRGLTFHGCARTK